MLDSWLEWLPPLLVCAGALLAVVGAWGLLRLPDIYCRLHAAGIVDTLAVALVLLGLVLWAGWSAASLKLVLIGLFLWVTSPTAVQMLARVALEGGVRPEEGPK